MYNIHIWEYGRVIIQYTYLRIWMSDYTMYIFRNMDETNCLGIHCFAEVHACTELMHRAKAFLLQHFQADIYSISSCTRDSVLKFLFENYIKCIFI